MPEIRGFRGLRYQKNVVGDLAKVLAPPYDVISPKEQAELHRLSPHNVVRLELGLDEKGDSVKRNRYTRAKEALARWTEEGALAHEKYPSIYVYEQEYKEGARTKKRVGFLAAMKLNEKEVMKHENTLAAPKRDRMALLSEVRTNLSPIFGLFQDKKGGIHALLKQTLRTKPVLDVRVDGVRHRLFVESSSERVAAIAEQMAERPMFIADGHHRFEVAMQFRERMKAEDPQNEFAGWNYVMTYFADLTHNPFTIWPTHRLIKAPKTVKDPLAALGTRGKLKKVGSLAAVLKKLEKTRAGAKEKGYTFGVTSRSKGFFIFTLDPKFVSQVKKDPVSRLDVAALHSMLIEPLFGIRKIEKSADIDFTRDAKAACDKVKAGTFDLALFLRPTSLDEMVEASLKGLKMPQKSTYFYPKIISGLVFHKFEEPVNV